MSSWLPNLRIVPGFPDYIGPYEVGSCDVELPVDQLESPTAVPDNASDIGTVAFRIFYPCDANSKERPIRWVPSPQRGYVSAYARFLGANSMFSEVFSYVDKVNHRH
jgi:platelet-activating factor acetylhydrolase